MQKVKSAHCEVCKSQQRFTKTGPNHVLNILLTIFTAGLWLVPYVIIAASAPWYYSCPTCGSKLGKPDLRGEWKAASERRQESGQRSLKEAWYEGTGGKTLRQLLKQGMDEQENRKESA